MSDQPIRPSQFILSHGVGSIIEMTGGPRLVPAFQQGLVPNLDRFGTSIDDFRLDEHRLTSTILREYGHQNPFIFRLPTNADLGVSDSVTLYRTFPFPLWSLCRTHHILYKVDAGSTRGCPSCHVAGQDLLVKARREADRFVLACKKGHLDEVPWQTVVPHRSATCPAEYYDWTGAGAGLRNVRVKCRSCGASVVFGKAYGRPYRCSGRFPESSAARPGCDVGARITQRLASNLRLTELVSALTIPPDDGPIQRRLLALGLDNVLSGIICRSKDEVIGVLRRLADRGRLDPSTIAEFSEVSERELLQAIEDITRPIAARNQEEIKDQEFRALKNAATHGHPAEASPHGNHALEVSRSEVRVIQTPHGRILRVTPVRRLRVVLVQVGYRRLGTDPIENELIQTPLTYPPPDSRTGYPGVELLGEGIFVDTPDESPLILEEGSALREWRRNSSTTERQSWPEAVWWHTLSHALLNGLAVDSGYSAASIRERVFVSRESESGRVAGGLLLYTSQPGGDGSLGGLIAQVLRFEQVLESSIYNLDPCANDPLCSENRFEHGRVNGAACYACCLASETSCELRNRGLDRNVLLETVP